MKRDAGSVTAIISILSMQSVSTQGTLTQTHTHTHTYVRAYTQLQGTQMRTGNAETLKYQRLNVTHTQSSTTALEY